jgi:uncharacterized protein (DUF58 family)
VRRYRQGDDPRQLDWRLLARSDRAYVRLTDDRIVRPTWLVLDASASMAFPSAEAADGKWGMARALAVGLLTLGAATALVLNAFNSNLVFFFSPTQVANGEAPTSRAFRIGGLVEEGSIKREADGLTVRFVVTDTAMTIPVTIVFFPVMSDET